MATTTTGNKRIETGITDLGVRVDKDGNESEAPLAKPDARFRVTFGTRRAVVETLEDARGLRAHYENGGDRAGFLTARQREARERERELRRKERREAVEAGVAKALRESARYTALPVTGADTTALVEEMADESMARIVGVSVREAWEYFTWQLVRNGVGRRVERTVTYDPPGRFDVPRQVVERGTVLCVERMTGHGIDSVLLKVRWDGGEGLAFLTMPKQVRPVDPQHLVAERLAFGWAAGDRVLLGPLDVDQAEMVVLEGVPSTATGTDRQVRVQIVAGRRKGHEWITSSIGLRDAGDLSGCWIGHRDPVRAVDPEEAARREALHGPKRVQWGVMAAADHLESLRKHAPSAEKAHYEARRTLAERRADRAFQYSLQDGRPLPVRDAETLTPTGAGTWELTTAQGLCLALRHQPRRRPEPFSVLDGGTWQHFLTWGELLSGARRISRRMSLG